jgi:hypothetical protein
MAVVSYSAGTQFSGHIIELLRKLDLKAAVFGIHF